MTYLKANKTNGTATDKGTEVKGNEVKYKKSHPIWHNENCIQACAWILLTLGLCIIVITFYLAVHQKHNDDSSRNFNVGYGADVDVYTPSLANSKENLTQESDNDKKWIESPQDSRVIIENIFGVIASTLIGCQEKVCKIACSHDGNLFLSLFKTMKSTSCPSIDVLLLESQDFPDNSLSNSWLPLNLSVYEVVIRSSNLTRIQSNAFNTPIFMNTFLMSWSSMTIDTVESGALLGLYKLKYLTIDSRLRKLEPAFFQPVQTTLTHLKLNSNLQLNGNWNLFGVGYMAKMEYLDLSYNNISGSLGKRMFNSTPNLKYLIMVDCHLQHIQDNAFAQLTDKLIFMNLSKNQLVTLSADVIEPILQNHVGAMISLSRNSWLCDCSMQSLSTLYRNYRNQFMDDVYCTAPHNLYGTSIDEVDYGKQNCDALLLSTTTVQGPVEEKEDFPGSSTKMTTTNIYANTPPIDFDSSDVLDSGEIKSEENSSIFKMRCLNVDSSESGSSASSSSASSSASSSSSSWSSTVINSSEILERNVDGTSETKDFEFAPPSYEFDLVLFTDNNSVLVVVESPDALTVMWFSEQQESDFVTCNNRTVDYECMKYAQPHLMVGPLVENTTYTFCLVPPIANSISPFNCMPLHVPLKRQENIWISQDHKQFTIGMLCLIFLVSTIMGAMVAYFGIKTYPDLLEGSKNVLVVKKPDKSCYVATISETEYIKQASLKKRKSTIKDEEKDKTNKEVLKKQPSIKLPLPAIPCTEAPETLPPPFHMSVRNLDMMLNSISTTPGFDDLYKEENYETPRSCENEYTWEQRSVPNSYCMTPGSPPPLPKRNSNISDSPTVVMNRFAEDM